MAGKKKDPKVVPLLDEVPLSASLAKAKVTSRSLSKGAYQKKLAAHFAPHILPKTLNALREAVQCGNTTAMKMVLELYEMIQTPRGVSVINDNRSVTVDARGDGSGGSRDLEQVLRSLDETRDRRISAGNPLASVIDISELTPTPEGISK